ncbi:hypothetical protein [Massilia sp. TS11]|uniref:hypothetical protein n=1 Tax=Massilia sp. TS11 TaxID=2908003 RepID=UPI001EDABDDC|nr:hypothetical protein [Massilia sp. TS11]MCG2583533.1 hypothetical protein [Massilia sp. TS11]
MKRTYLLTATLAILALAALTLVLPPAAAAEASTLDGYAACAFRAPLVRASVEHFSSKRQYRKVRTADGEEKVSVLEGTRLMLNDAGGTPFVNLKFERSLPGQIDADRTAILAQMRYLANTPRVPVPLEQSEHAGIERIAIVHSGVDDDRVLSIVTLIDRVHELVVTAYFLNAAPGQRSFASMPEFLALRDGALADLDACLRAPR